MNNLCKNRSNLALESTCRAEKLPPKTPIETGKRPFPGPSVRSVLSVPQSGLKAQTGRTSGHGRAYSVGGPAPPNQ